MLAVDNKLQVATGWSSRNLTTFTISAQFELGRQTGNYLFASGKVRRRKLRDRADLYGIKMVEAEEMSYVIEPTEVRRTRARSYQQEWLLWKGCPTI